MALTTVNTEGIKNDSIKNEDIKSDAAIAGSKISPAFTADITGTGDLTLTGSSKKFISESSSTDDYVRIYAGSGTGKWDIYGNGANLRFSDNDSAGNIVFDRNVGIGIADPINAYGIDRSLHIHSTLTSGNRGAGIHLTTNSSGSATGDGARIAQIDTDLMLYNHEVGGLYLGTGGTEAIRIDSNQNVSIGNVDGSIDRLLHLEGSSCFMRFTNPATGPSNGDIMGMIEFETKDSSDPGVAANIRSEIVNTDGTCGLFFSAGKASSTGTKLTITGDKVMFSADAKVGTGDTYDLGANGARWKDLYLSGNVKVASGKGIDFSDRGHATGMTSELFDNYEEGTWTPVVGGTTSNPTDGGTGWTHQVGRYTIVGRLIYVSFYLYHASKDLSGGNGIVAITGLPVSCIGSTSSGYPRININYSDNAGNYHSDGSGASHLGGPGWQVNNASTDTLLQYTSTRTEWGSGAASWELSGNGILEMA